VDILPCQEYHKLYLRTARKTHGNQPATHSGANDQVTKSVKDRRQVLFSPDKLPVDKKHLGKSW